MSNIAGEERDLWQTMCIKDGAERVVMGYHSIS